MLIDDLELYSIDRLNEVYNEILSRYDKYLSDIPFKTGDFVIRVHEPGSPDFNKRPYLFKILSMEVENNNEAGYIRLPKIKIHCQKHTKNGIPTKGYYPIEPENFVLYDPKIELVIKKPKCTYVYLIEAGDIFKIGFSNNPEKRLYGIQTSNPHICKILYKIADPIGSLEKDLHTKFEKFRLNGEWFTKNELIVNTFEQLSKDNGSSLRTNLTLFNNG